MSNYSVSLVGPAPWGFRLQGGKDFNVPLSISRLNDGGKAAQAHVGIGDVVLTIDGISTDGMTHLEAQNKIKACTGNLNMTLQRVSSIQKPDHFHVTKAEPTEVVKPVPIASAVAPKATATASVAFNKTPRPFGAVASSKVTSIPSPSSAFTPAQAGVHANAKPNAEPWPPAPAAAKPAVPVPRQHGAADGAQDAAEGPRRGGRDNQGESKQQNGKNPPKRPPRKHIVDTYTEFYHTPTHSDASKKRLIEDTEDWHPRTGTTQSRSFRILAQITGTDHMKEPENEAGKKTKKRQTENGDFSLPADLPDGAGTQDTCINIDKKSVVTPTLERPPAPEFPSTPLPPLSENSARPEPAAALLLIADSCPGSVPSPRLSEHIAAPASDSLEAAQPAPARSIPACQDSVDVRAAPANSSPAPALKPVAPLGSAKGWQPPSQAAPVSGWTSNSIKSPGTTASSEKAAPTPQLNEQDTLVQRAEHIPAGKRTPMCAHCNQVIRGPFLVALGKSWHPEEFNCAHCKTSMAYIGFVEEKGMLYCEVCYEKFFAPECSKCQRKILGEVINALKQTWHVSCFVCVACHNPIRNNVFHLEDGDPYCETDYYALFGTMCRGCEFPIEAGDRFLEALGHTWHDTCFVCSVCSDSLEGQTFFSKKDKPLCKKHAHSINI
ncbi:PDZ and LIM domain protein 5 isoform X7 [Zonotrichia albicollis]|uniref:PDZ and LIM domain protein 5 isoform X7 n=1 Tax=Zonotrichia albicollis TaxID=44394 RepID=UPI003D80F4B7